MDRSMTDPNITGSKSDETKLKISADYGDSGSGNDSSMPDWLMDNHDQSQKHKQQKNLKSNHKDVAYEEDVNDNNLVSNESDANSYYKINTMSSSKAGESGRRRKRRMLPARARKL